MGYRNRHSPVQNRPRGDPLRRHHSSGKGRQPRQWPASRLTWHQLTYDLATQVSPSELPALRSQILLLLKHFAAGPKPIRVQLCVCLAILAIQMKDWNDVLPSVVQSLSGTPESHACILDFLRVLPEEVTEGRNISLSVRGFSSLRPGLRRLASAPLSAARYRRGVRI